MRLHSNHEAETSPRRVTRWPKLLGGPDGDDARDQEDEAGKLEDHGAGGHEVKGGLKVDH